MNALVLPALASTILLVLIFYGWLIYRRQPDEPLDAPTAPEATVQRPRKRLTRY